jgi:hypothetical protein
MKHGHRMFELREVVGKSIRRFRFTNDEDFRAVSIDFTDGTALNFQLELDLKARVELLTLKAGNITNVKRLRPAPVVGKRPAKN